MAGYYLLKTEPSEYSFEDLKRDGATQWDDCFRIPSR